MQTINVGTVAFDGTGDPRRDAFIKINSNFAALSVLEGDPIAVSGSGIASVSASIGRMHLCAGDGTGGRTLMLPAATTNTGKILGVQVSHTATGFITLDGASNEGLDGAATRWMRSGESAILMSDSRNWRKIGGDPRPYRAQISMTTAQQITRNTWTPLIYGATNFGDAPSMSDTLLVQRSGSYRVYGKATITGHTGGELSNNIKYIIFGAQLNTNANSQGVIANTYLSAPHHDAGNYGYASVSFSEIVELAAGDVISGYFVLWAPYVDVRLIGGRLFNYIGIEEINPW
jgi:hypothetical protein